MNLFRQLSAMVMFVLVAAAFSGCQPPTVATIAADLRDRFDESDADSDGQLSLAEAQAANSDLTEANFNEIDTNTDGFLSLAELDAAAETGGEGEIDLTAVSTKIEMHQQGMIRAGDDLIAYGFGGFNGVDYIIPSEFETDGTGLGIPGGDGFQAGNFAVAGKKIALTSNFLVSIYDTETETMTEIPEADVRLVNSPSGQRAQGTLQADGNLIIVRNDDSVTGNHAAVIDVTGATPVVIDLASPTGENEISGIGHAVVDAEARVAVGTTSLSGVDTFVVWDLDNPAAEPVLYAFDRGIDDALMQIEGDFLLFHDAAFDSMVEICALNYTDGTFTTSSEAKGSVALNGGSFLFFLNRAANDNNGGDSRSAIGSMDATTDIASFIEAGDAAGANFIDGSTTNNGVFGWGQMGAITDDGNLIFVSGFDTVGSGEYLQVSNGGGFSVVQCPTCIDDDYGARGSNVDIYGNTVAFKNGDNSGLTHVAFVILP